MSREVARVEFNSFSIIIYIGVRCVASNEGRVLLAMARITGPQRSSQEPICRLYVPWVSHIGRHHPQRRHPLSISLAVSNNIPTTKYRTKVVVFKV